MTHVHFLCKYCCLDLFYGVLGFSIGMILNVKLSHMKVEANLDLM